jgi:hypothetical protein
MGLWGRGQQQRQWRAEFKDVPTPELRRKVDGSLYPPDKQQFLEGLLRQREQQPPYTVAFIIGIIGGVIAIIAGAIAIVEAIW